MPNETQNLPAVNYFSPVEVVGLYRKYLDKGSTNNVVWIRGIYIIKIHNGLRSMTS